MSRFTGRKEVSRMRSEDMLVNEMNTFIKDLEKIRDECSENRHNDLRREIMWKKIRDMQKILRKG